MAELKNEIKSLNNIKYYHQNICDKNKTKLKKELENLKLEKLNELNNQQNNLKFKKIQLFKKHFNKYKIKTIDNSNSKNKNKNKSYKNIIIKKINTNNDNNNLSFNSFSQRNILPEIINFTSEIKKLKKNESVKELSFNSLFSKNEKKIFEKYKIIPEKGIKNYEKKYDEIIKQNYNNYQKIKNINNNSANLKLDISYKIINNEITSKKLDKQINNIKFKISTNKIIIKNVKKKLHDLMNEEKEIDNKLGLLNERNMKLKEFIKFYEEIQDINQEENDIKIEQTIENQLNKIKNDINLYKSNSFNENDDDNIIQQIPYN